MFRRTMRLILFAVLALSTTSCLFLESGIFENEIEVIAGETTQFASPVVYRNQPLFPPIPQWNVTGLYEVNRGTLTATNTTQASNAIILQVTDSSLSETYQIIPAGQGIQGSSITLSYTPDAGVTADILTVNIITATGVAPLRTPIVVKDPPILPNDAPVNVVPGNQLVPVGERLALNFDVSDPDIYEGLYDIRISIDAGTLELPLVGTTGGDVFTISSDGRQINITAPDARVRNYLTGIVWVAPADITYATLTMFTNDRGNTGTNQMTDTDTVAITAYIPEPPPETEPEPPVVIPPPQQPIDECEENPFSPNC